MAALPLVGSETHSMGKFYTDIINEAGKIFSSDKTEYTKIDQLKEYMKKKTNTDLSDQETAQLIEIAKEYVERTSQINQQVDINTSKIYEKNGVIDTGKEVEKRMEDSTIDVNDRVLAEIENLKKKK